MLHRILHTLTFYLLRKSLFERIIIFCLFVACLLAILSSITYEEWVSTERKQIDITNIQDEISTLFEEYKIQSKCARVICTNKELQKRRLQTTLPHTTKHYTLFFSCNSILCYEFIRSIESIPTLFIHEVDSFNVTIQDLFQDNYIQEHPLFNDYTSNMQWKQDMKIVFSIGKYQL